MRRAAKRPPANPGRRQIAPGSNAANNFIMRIAFFNRGAPPPGPHPTKAGPCFAGPGPIARVIRRAPSRNDLDKSQQFKRVKRKPGARIETGRLPEAPKRPTMRARRGRGGEKREKGLRRLAATRPVSMRLRLFPQSSRRPGPTPLFRLGRRRTDYLRMRNSDGKAGFEGPRASRRNIL